MLRLVRVELRKMLTTRSSRWVRLGILAFVLVFLAAVVTQSANPRYRSFTFVAELATFVIAWLLPVLGILTATTEWTQRTVLGTFTLIPKRSRIIAAKVLGALALSALATVAALVLATIATALAPTAGLTPMDWSIDPVKIVLLFLFSALSMLLGLALGTAFLNSKMAITVYFIFPTLWAAITTSILAIQDVQPWITPMQSWNLLLEPAPISIVNWGQIVTAALLWIALPLMIGTRRVLRREVA